MQIDYQYPFYTDLTVEHGGFLTRDKRSHACFNYYLLAQKLFEQAGESIEDQVRYDDELWWDKPYGALAKSVAIRYGLENPGEFLKPDIKYLVEQEVKRQEFPTPRAEYWGQLRSDTLVMV